MNPDELCTHRNKPVLYNGSRYILRAARIYTDSTGRRYPQLKLQDEKHPWSYIIARVEDVKPIG